jgi:hypothetical protein
MSTDGSGQYVSEFTKKTLLQFDWQPGEPVPTDLGDVLAEIKERTPPSKVPGLFVDIDNMSAEDIALVKETLLGAKTAIENSKRQQEFDRKTAGLDESARQLYAKLTEQSTEAAQIIDDRKTAAAKPTPEPVVAPTAASPAPEPVKPEPVKEEEPVVNLKDPLTEEPEPLVEKKDAPPPFCPRCSWDMRREFDIEITDEDKEAFVAVTLGNERFKKTFELMAGKYKVRFRSLLAEENTIIHHQMLLDQRDNHFLSDTEWFLRMFEYRLACSIEEVTVDGTLIAAIPELDAVSDKTELPNKADDPTKAAVVRLREYALVAVLRNEITRRLVGNQFRLFQRLYETLEAMALEPNFW